MLFFPYISYILLHFLFYSKTFKTCILLKKLLDHTHAYTLALLIPTKAVVVLRNPKSKGQTKGCAF